ncbi:PREDICTED: EKC/KEOPS complex subunit TPRKB-like [Dufourea novaeangliae]|uniref:TP53RK-binding protein n=1 Tax=Dufourea novaeangliae TaxID=178035 RepID=A0A154P7Z2_DUFNO|nr:PREDICTED: EKC/KEOPS complex subunit TPRKB-like [Dufourea novaeangliae]KZC07240.1 TP53RK-binding protein [Dufourea novaeangliae]
MDAYTVPLDAATEMFCTLYLFTNVQNPEEVRAKVINGELCCSAIKAALIVDPFQVLVAANKAVVNEKMCQLTTKSVYTELLFNLSISKNISRSLAEFGINDHDKNILIAQIHKMDDEKSLSKALTDIVKGEQTQLSRLYEFSDVDLIKKTYKIDKDELILSSLTDSIVSRISCKEFILLK